MHREYKSEFDLFMYLKMYLISFPGAFSTLLIFCSIPKELSSMMNSIEENRSGREDAILLSQAILLFLHHQALHTFEQLMEVKQTN